MWTIFGINNKGGGESLHSRASKFKMRIKVLSDVFKIKAFEAIFDQLNIHCSIFGSLNFRLNGIWL